MQLVLTIVSSSRLLAQKHPGAVPISRQINELAQKLQQVILQSSPQQEPQAPPV